MALGQAVEKKVFLIDEVILSIFLWGNWGMGVFH